MKAPLCIVPSMSILATAFPDSVWSHPRRAKRDFGRMGVSSECLVRAKSRFSRADGTLAGCGAAHNVVRRVLVCGTCHEETYAVTNGIFVG